MTALVYRDTHYGGALVYADTAPRTGTPPPDPGAIDATKVPVSRIVVFEGNKRVVTFEGNKREVKF